MHTIGQKFLLQLLLLYTFQFLTSFIRSFKITTRISKVKCNRVKARHFSKKIWSPATSYWSYTLFTFTTDHTLWRQMYGMGGANVKPDVYNMVDNLRSLWDPRSDISKFIATISSLCYFKISRKIGIKLLYCRYLVKK